MGYKCQDFCNGQKLDAEHLKRMEDGILAAEGIGDRHFMQSPNLIDMSLLEVGKLKSNGTVDTTNTAGKTTGFIKVEPGKWYVTNFNGTRCTYDVNKGYRVGPLDIKAGTPFEAVVRDAYSVHYVRLFCGNSNAPTIWALEGADTKEEATYVPTENPFGVSTLQNCELGEQIDKTLSMRGKAADAEAVGVVTLHPEFLPVKEFYHVTGHPNRLYLQNISYDPLDLYFYSITPVGQRGKRYMNYDGLATNAYSTHTITRRTAKTRQNIVELSYSFKMAESSAKSGQTVKAMIIGDSTTAAGHIPARIMELCAADGITLQLVGTNTTTVNGVAVKHEGRSGWSTNDYVTAGERADNPFIYNGAFNFSSFMADNSLDAPDWVFIQLGINDQLRHGDNSTAENLSAMVESINAFNASIKIAIGLVLPPYYGEHKGLASLDQHQYRLMQNAEIINCFSDKDGIYIVPINCYLDTEYGFNMGTQAVGGGITTEVPVCTDITHPSVEGYYQIAEAWFAFLMNQ